jgi:hypothetical protein
MTAKLLIFFFGFIICFKVFGQNGYSNGYIITIDGVKKECLVRNKDTFVTPNRIRVLYPNENEPKDLGTDLIKEFGFENHRFIRAKVNIDQSSQDARYLSAESSPNWIEKEVFLRFLIDGKADLFHFYEDGKELYFFRMDTLEIVPLVYKLYLTPHRTSLSENTRGYQLSAAAKNLTFISQLNSSFANCPDFKKYTIKSINYNRSSLVKAFKEYNSCMNSSSETYSDLTMEVKFRLRPGIDVSTSSFKYYHNTVYDPSMNFRFGVEMALILPYNKKKWEILIEPAFQNYTTPQPIDLKYQSIELSSGLRYKIPIAAETKLFLNTQLVIDIPLKITGKWPNTTSFESNSLRMLNTTGGGASFKKFQLEYRFYSKRTRFDGLGAPIFDFVKSSIILSYEL